MDKGGKAKTPSQNLHSGHRQRLRQAYLQRGGENLYDHQLLELLLTYALPRRDTNGIAHRLLSREGFGSLKGVLSADVHQLGKIEGIGETAAILISLIGAIGCRIRQEEVVKAQLDTPDAAMRYCVAMAKDSPVETMYMISMDRRKNVLYTEEISTGIPGETTVYPRKVVELAIRRGAENVILFHNHPTGDLRASKQDLETTMAVLNALNPIGITLCDHIITGKGDAYSIKKDTTLMDVPVAVTLAAVAERKE